MAYRYPVYIVGGLTQSGSTKAYASLLYYLKKYKNSNTIGIHDSDLPWARQPEQGWNSADEEWVIAQTKRCHNFLGYLNTAPVVIKTHRWFEECATQLLVQQEGVRLIFIRCIRDLRDILCSQFRKANKKNEEIDEGLLAKSIKNQLDLYVNWDREFMYDSFTGIQVYYGRSACTQWECYDLLYEEYHSKDREFVQQICKIGNRPNINGAPVSEEIVEDLSNFFNHTLLAAAATSKEPHGEYLITDTHITNGGKIGGSLHYFKPKQLQFIDEQFRENIKHQQFGISIGPHLEEKMRRHLLNTQRKL